jgi:exodeoxyribonuclease VII small subunit
VSIPKDSAEAHPSSQVDVDRGLTPDLSAQDWSYEATVQQVEAIMARIESGDLELADVFDQFSSAVSYLRQCDLFLTQRQQQMDLLIETLTDDPD